MTNGWRLFQLVDGCGEWAYMGYLITAEGIKDGHERNLKALSVDRETVGPRDEWGVIEYTSRPACGKRTVDLGELDDNGAAKPPMPLWECFQWAVKRLGRSKPAGTCEPVSIPEELV